MAEHAAEKDARTLDPCAEHPGCYKGLTVYGPQHASICPRYRGNAEHNCGDCGAATNYAPHALWCPRVRVTPPAE